MVWIYINITIIRAVLSLRQKGRWKGREKSYRDEFAKIIQASERKARPLKKSLREGRGSYCGEKAMKLSVFAKTGTGRFTFCSDTQLLPKSLCCHVCYHENIFKFDYFLVIYYFF